MTSQSISGYGASPISDLSPPDQPAYAQSATSSQSKNSSTALGPLANPATPANGGTQLESQVADALKKVGITANISFSKSGDVIVQYIDPQSQHVMFQIPSQGVLDMVANLSRALDETDPAVAGAIIDQRA